MHILYVYKKLPDNQAELNCCSCALEVRFRIYGKMNGHCGRTEGTQRAVS